MDVAELEILKVDVFTNELYMGNPASVVPEADTLDEVQMQRISFDAGSPSTAFVLRSKKADVRLRYFSPFSEELLSGHATVGAVWCLAERGGFGGVTGGRHRIETSAGILPFSLEGDTDGLRKVWMTQKRPMFAGEGDIKDVASALGIGVDSLFHDEFPISRASTGLPCLIVPVRSIDVIGKLEPRRDELTALSRELDVAGIYVFTWGVLEEGSTVHARFFVPLPGMQEDPASGLPAGALGAYLVENEFIPREKFETILIEQGHWMGRPSRIHVRVEKRGSTIHKVEVGGSAVVSFRGRLVVP
jgi:trans-2,3-dihydro-3-hydroxyanthranilate isomerase